MMNKLKGMTGVRLSALGALAATVAFAVSAGAGAVANMEVSMSGNWVYGSVSGARYSTDRTQYIGCSLAAGGWGSCWALHRNGTFKSCYTYDEIYRQAIGGINSASRIDFEVDPATNYCNTLSISVDSRYLR